MKPRTTNALIGGVVSGMIAAGICGLIAVSTGSKCATYARQIATVDACLAIPRCEIKPLFSMSEANAHTAYLDMKAYLAQHCGSDR